MKEFGDVFDCVLFPTLVSIVAETAFVSSRTLPVEFPLPTISKEFFVHAVLFPDS